ncbi:tripeptidyl peptidase precursor [Metarhizium album ARSEF 1941]|uniref:tripeptidyl-peptidase II n=1 Tax=Metarhizium album (strain ARSEF 1941) TaxID=1081103 RepID=A0A0B2WMY0_METAS|nr:tripeptidyl peptidase precursor [Metarhizium album ARSEF 1941]KHN95049.1 tripeptidyl peptidase precursor [Metarhizium album ARSEF 1941]
MAPSLLVAACTFARLATSAICVEKATTIPDGWQMLDEMPDASTPMRFSIALRQPEMHTLPSKILAHGLLDINDTRSLKTPAKQDVDRVMAWLSCNGISGASLDMDWIHVPTTVGQAERLLDTRLRRYSYHGRKPILRATEYNIPDSLSESIDFIHPIANFMTPEHEVSVEPPLAAEDQGLHRRDVACSPVTTLDCINNLYGINYTTPDGESCIRFGIAGFLEQWASYADTQQSFRRSRPDLVKAGYNFTVELIQGGENRQDLGTAGSEASLDIQYGMAVGFPANVIYYSTGGRGQKIDENGKPLTGELDDNEPYLELLQYLSSKTNHDLPDVLSISYADDELSVPRAYAIRVCHEIGMLTARGVSVLASSGDGGARGGSNATCRSNDGSNKEMTISTFPASCPWVTSVGAVDNGQEPPNGSNFSSGGFSAYFPRPDWQDTAVEEYVSELNGHLEGYYNPEMRAVPDISAIGTRFSTIINGTPLMLRGTSASTPVLAGMIALVNDARVRQGKPVLGWLNKRLYSEEVRSVLQDITTGQSFSCDFSGDNKPGGWPATKGYDAITGLGVPNDFTKFMDVLVNMD